MPPVSWTKKRCRWSRPGGRWKRWTIDLLAGQDIHHQTLGIFGMGRIGQAVARRARGFSMRVLYHDNVRAPEALERDLVLEFVSAEQLLRCDGSLSQ